MLEGFIQKKVVKDLYISGQDSKGKMCLQMEFFRPKYPYVIPNDLLS